MTANDSSSSATNPPEEAVDLVAAGLMAPLPAAFLGGRDLDLLAPLSFSATADVPAGAPGGGAANGAAANGSANGATPVDRGTLARELAVANRAYGHSRAAELAARLADPATQVVVTGQQPGLFGGPLYTLSKAVAASLWADRLAASGVPAVAVFWVATEDHDFREVSRTAIFGSDGPRAFDLGDDGSPLVPVGMRTLGDRTTTVLEEMADAVGTEDYRNWLRQVGRWYRPEARFGEAFCRLLASLLGDRCPLLLDSMLPAVKEAQRPWLQRLVAERHHLAAAVARREEAIAERGYKLQVRPQPAASPLFFLHHGERRRIEWRGEADLVLRGADNGERSVAWLSQAIDDNPAVVSPGVLARPAIQDAILGTRMLILGPGELSYMPQVAPVYELLDLDPPTAVLRPQMLVLEPGPARKLEASGLDLASFLAADFNLDSQVAGDQEETLLAPARQRMAELLAGLEATTLPVAPDLASPLAKTGQQMARALDTFSAKVVAALARRQEVSRSRAEAVRQACRPWGKLQERVISSVHFPGRYGSRFVDAVCEQLGLDPAKLHVVRPGDGGTAPPKITADREDPEGEKA